jgi:hypothetical protein
MRRAYGSGKSYYTSADSTSAGEGGYYAVYQLSTRSSGTNLLVRISCAVEWLRIRTSLGWYDSDGWDSWSIGVLRF